MLIGRAGFVWAAGRPGSSCGQIATLREDAAAFNAGDLLQVALNENISAT